MYVVFNTWITYFLVIIFVFLGDLSKNRHDLFYGLFNYINSDDKNIVCFDSNSKKNILEKKKVSVSNVLNRVYNNKNHGSYHCSIYVVQPGDTLYYIAWLTGSNYLDLAKKNKIDDLNCLQVGQILRINDNIKLLYNLKCTRYFIVIFFQCNHLIKNIIFFVKKNISFFCSRKDAFFFDMKEKTDQACDIELSKMHMISNSWKWPTCGKIINSFSDSDRGNTGIDISGVLGQPIFAAANGTVIYVGNKLKGYGNLIIIKHHGDYLSAYAHNNTVLVMEQQVVKVGDKIATMGSTGSNEVKLHFEIRYKGKSVNPLYFLHEN